MLSGPLSNTPPRGPSPPVYAVLTCRSGFVGGNSPQNSSTFNPAAPAGGRLSLKLLGPSLNWTSAPWSSASVNCRSVAVVDDVVAAVVVLSADTTVVVVGGEGFGSDSVTGGVADGEPPWA